MNLSRRVLPKMIGDCGWCGHSIAYHIPLYGCVKCDCDEYS